MQFHTPTILGLLAAAKNAAKARLQLLLLLAGLAGIMTSIVYAPALAVLEELMAALENASSVEGGETEAAAIFREGASTLLFGHLATTAVSCFLLIPFARAAAPGGLIPGGGGTGAMWRRGLRSFLHMVAASGITMLIVLFAVPIVALISSALGPLGSAVMLAAVCAIVWVAISLTGTAHLAIAAEARDRRETLPSAFMRARLFMVPIAGSLALMLLLMMVTDLLIGGLLMAILPAEFYNSVGTIFSGSLLFITSALHVAALYNVPDFRDLRPA